MLFAVRVWADPYQRAFQRMTAVRGRPRREREVELTSLRWLGDKLDLPTQLHRAGVSQSPTMFLLSCGVYGLGVIAAAAAMDILLLEIGDGAPIPPLVAVVAGLAVAVLKIVELPRRVARRRAVLEDSMTRVMTVLTILRASEAITNVSEGLLLCARCLDDPTLAQFLEMPRASEAGRTVDFRVLAGDAEKKEKPILYQLIAEQYGLSVFSALADALRSVGSSRAMSEALGDVARRHQARQVAADEGWVDLAEVKANAPMTLFILLLFAMVLAPLMGMALQGMSG
jgi:hypothetical protein